MGTSPFRTNSDSATPGNRNERFKAAERYRAIVLESGASLAQAFVASQSAAAAHQNTLRTLNSAKELLEALVSGRGPLLAEIAGVSLYQFWIDLPGHSGPVQGARADVAQSGDVHRVSDVTGTTKSGLGGAIVGGLLLGPVGAAAGLVATRKNNIKTQVRTVDTRQFELTVAGPGYAWSTVQGPECADDFRELRDKINARGSSREALSSVTSEQMAIVTRETSTVASAETAAQTAARALSKQEGAYGSAWESYVQARLPFRDDLRTRWGRASWVARAGAILAGPAMLTTWIAGLGVAVATRHPNLQLAGCALGVTQIIGLLLLAWLYMDRVRLRRSGWRRELKGGQ